MQRKEDVIAVAFNGSFHYQSRQWSNAIAGIAESCKELTTALGL